jgi:hypothetical protein
VPRAVEAGRPTLSVALHRDGRPRAVLRARKPSGAADFDRQARHDLEVLVARADAWLGTPHEVAGAEPAVVRVRASVERLDALAGRSASAVQVSAELYELERAVASLLGGAGLPAAAVPQQRSVPAGEWTTTGAVR